jgi:hypothetical protein
VTPRPATARQDLVDLAAQHLPHLAGASRRATPVWPQSPHEGQPPLRAGNGRPRGVGVGGAALTDESAAARGSRRSRP